MPRLHAAVAADIQVPAFFRGDHANVLALRFGALARAARYRHLQLVRRAQPPVALLDANRHRHRVLHAVAAPGAADAGLDRPEGLAVGVTRFEAGVDELLPDERQLLHPRAEQVEALRARDLGVKAEFLRHLAQHDQLGGRDFPARDPRYDRVRAVLLEIRQEM